jgi:hypothetical protein
MSRCSLLISLLCLFVISRCALQHDKKTSVTKTEIYKIPYYGTCTNSSCGKNLYCVNGKCIKSLDGAKGSYCGFWSWIFCDSGLNCVDNICLDKSKQSLIKFVKGSTA